MRCCGDGIRRAAGAVMVVLGVLIVFLCLPARFFVIALGVGLAAAGLALLAS